MSLIFSELPMRLSGELVSARKTSSERASEQASEQGTTRRPGPPSLLALLLTLLFCLSAEAAPWRTGFIVTSQSGPIAGFPYSKYTHLSLIGLDCNGTALVLSGWSPPSDWPAFRSAATAAGTKI